MHKKGRFLLITGLLLMVAALSLALYNVWDSQRAGQSANAIMLELEIPSELQKAVEPSKWKYMKEDSPTSLSELEMPTQLINDLRCIGVLEVPEYQLRLPVICDWDYEKLEMAPCVFSGSYYTGDLVICGHNYSTHFSSLKYIPLGSDVYFTTVDGYVFHYLVDNLETIQPDAVEEMVSADNWDLTLFT